MKLPMQNDPDKTIRENLVSIAETYAKATGLAMATVGRKFHGKQRFFVDLKAGICGLTTAKLGEILRAFGAAWPRGVVWPPMRAVSMRRPPRGKKSMEKSGPR